MISLLLKKNRVQEKIDKLTYIMIFYYKNSFFYNRIFHIDI